MKISIIVAIDENNAIGKDNHLLCHLPADMRMFRELTTGHTVIMGRKTFESLPNGALPERRNIVITRQPPSHFSHKGVEIVSSLMAAFELCKREQEIFIIGGAEIYKSALKCADFLYITKIHHSFSSADTHFHWNKQNWQKVEQSNFSGNHSADEKNLFNYSFIKYERNGQKTLHRNLRLPNERGRQRSSRFHYANGRL